MSLISKARKVAAEFEYSSKELNNGVREFIREMGRLDLPRRRSSLSLLTVVVLQTRAFKRMVPP